MIESQEVFTLNNPVSPFYSYYVLPPRCSHLLPQQLSYLLSSESSPLKEFIPETVNVDCSGKRQEWEGIVILPNVNLDIVQREYDKNYPNVSEQDKRKKYDKTKYTLHTKHHHEIIYSNLFMVI